MALGLSVLLFAQEWRDGVGGVTAGAGHTLAPLSLVLFLSLFFR